MSDLLSTIESLPVINIETIAGSALVVAPHPDDETLGCGGAIALMRQLKIPVAVSIVSDGTQSHPNSVAYPYQALKSLRERESLAALAILGVNSDAVTFWEMPDGCVHLHKSKAIASVRNYLNNLAPSVIFLPWRDDPHPDHRASWQLFMAASDRLSNPPRIIEYPIWDWDTQQRGQFADSVRAWRLDISSVLESKKQAIAQYRSQISNLIDDDPEGFRLKPEMLQNFLRPWEMYLELNHEPTKKFASAELF